MPSRPRRTQRLRYTFDDRNRLLVADSQEALAPQQILDGRVTLDGRNRLVYQVTNGSPRGGRSVPRAIRLDGSWSLTPAHELALTLHDAERPTEQTVYLKGALVDADANTLVFALRQREDEDLRTAQRLSLSGRWRADAQNRLTFLVEKSDGAEDRLTLGGGWELGDHHELLYRYRRGTGKRSASDEQTLSFDGAWDITASDRLVYRLAGSSDSAFEFRASLQSPSLLASDGRLVYQVGIGLAAGRTQQRRVTLFGTWKLRRDLSVAFEVPYADGRVQAIQFEGAYAPSRRDRVAVALRARPDDGGVGRKALGLTVTFTRDVTPDLSMFLRLRQEAGETSAIGGVQVRF